jgi:hypothetical protein
MGEPQKQLLTSPESAFGIARAARLGPERAASAESAGAWSNRALQDMLRSGVLQARLVVNSPGDPYELEAERTADRVLQMPAPDEHAGYGSEHQPSAHRLTLLQRAPAKHEEKEKKKEDDEKRVQKKDAGGMTTPQVEPRVESAISAMQNGGAPLSPDDRVFFEQRFGYDLGSVRVHAGADAARAASALQAQAFTVGQHVFFGAGHYEPHADQGKRLLAHELTHTIQQTPDRSRVMPRAAPGPRPRTWPVPRQPLAPTLAPRAVQRAWYDVDIKGKVLAVVAEKVRAVLFWELLTVLIGKDPITDEPKERTAVNLVHAILRMVPDGEAIFKDLEESKQIEKTVAWLEAEIAKLNLTWPAIKALFVQARDSLSAEDLLAPMAALERVKKIFEPTLTRVKAFVTAIGTRIYEAIKNKVLAKFGEWAKAQKGYELLTFMLGKDPFTNEVVPRTAKKFVHAVLVLVPDGEKIYENLEKAQAIERTVEWLEGEIAKLDLSWEKIKGLFRKFFDVLSAKDLLAPLQLIEKVADIFGEPVRRVLAFALAVGKKVLVFIFEGVMMVAGPMGMQVVGIVRKIGDTFNKIIADPVRFFGNLVQAVRLGFEQFSANILEHLKTGLIQWLVGALEGAGITLPEKWDLQGILSLALQILGITYAKMRAKMVALIGEERVAMIERVFEFIKLIVTKGLSAAWEKIVETLGNLWDMVIGGIRDWAVTKIVTAAITKIATMLNPVGAIVQAIIGIYNTIAFFVERIKQILALVEAIVDSIASIVEGKLSQAANYVEKTMARTIPVILGFLARLIGLGDVSGAIRKVVETIQAKVDLAIDKVIAWVVEKVKSLFGKGEERKDAKWEQAVAGVSAEVDKMDETENGISAEDLQKNIPNWKTKYGFTALEVKSSKEGLEIDGEMSPGRKVKLIPIPITAEELQGQTFVQVPRGAGWYVARLESFDAEKKTVLIRVVWPKSPEATVESTFKAHGKSWKKYVPGEAPITDPETWKTMSAPTVTSWTEFAHARQVLNYRRNENNSFSQPSGFQWHHIHEQSAAGPNSVANLAYTSANNNLEFKRFFDKPQSGIRDLDGNLLPSTYPLPLRDWLRGKTEPEHTRWGLACIRWHKLGVVPHQDATKGAWQEIPGSAA